MVGVLGRPFVLSGGAAPHPSPLPRGARGLDWGGLGLCVNSAASWRSVSRTSSLLRRARLSAAARCEREAERVSARRRVALAPERTVVREEPKRPGNNAGAAQVRAPV